MILHLRLPTDGASQSLAETMDKSVTTSSCRGRRSLTGVPRARHAGCKPPSQVGHAAVPFHSRRAQLTLEPLTAMPALNTYLPSSLLSSALLSPLSSTSTVFNATLLLLLFKFLPFFY